MDKMKLAHDYAMKHIQEGWDINYDVIVVDAWQYADAMQAEADKRKPSGLPEALKEEWQPDWSQAPDGYNWFCVGGCSGAGYFCNIEPVIYKDHYWFTGEDAVEVKDHGYQGNWKESLRERPNGF